MNDGSYEELNSDVDPVLNEIDQLSEAEKLERLLEYDYLDPQMNPKNWQVLIRIIKLKKSSLELDLKAKKVTVMDKAQFAKDYKDITNKEVIELHKFDRSGSLKYKNIGFNKITFEFNNWDKLMRRMVRYFFYY